MQQHILRIIRINLNVENGFTFRVKTRVLFPKFDVRFACKRFYCRKKIMIPSSPSPPLYFYSSSFDRAYIWLISGCRKYPPENFQQFITREISRDTRALKKEKGGKKKKKQKRKFSINSRTTFPEKEEVALKEHPVSESAIFLARGKTRDERERRGW